MEVVKEIKSTVMHALSPHVDPLVGASSVKLKTMHLSPVVYTKEITEFFVGSALTEDTAIMLPDETLMPLTQREIDLQKAHKKEMKKQG